MGLRRARKNENWTARKRSRQNWETSSCVLCSPADRAVDLVEAGRVEQGLTLLAEIVDRAGEDGVGTGPVFALIGLTDAYLWGLRLSEGINRRGQRSGVGTRARAP